MLYLMILIDLCKYMLNLFYDNNTFQTSLGQKHLKQLNIPQLEDFKKA